ncbi:class I SAM-dependent methyltransferase [Patescibacteria group bacterium]|nr:class I SAM-dependent methyltransferase [Patescibacteria group bacterium]
MRHLGLSAEPWGDYELADSGAGEKLERFGSVVLARPETQAIWEKRKSQEWEKAAARFKFSGGKGSWEKKRGVPDKWSMGWESARFTLRLTAFKHIGLFPEQAVNWEWLKERVGRLERSRVLNLFGYTGIASIVSAQSGAAVTHVDASKQSNAWAKENAALSGVPEGSIRFLLDDALKFVQREGRRGSIYDGIILDPPAFGRGPNGEVWRIEDDLLPLLKALAPLLSGRPGSFFLMSGYAAGYSATSFFQAAQDAFRALPEGGEFGELNIKESGSDRLVPSGIYIRFSL